MDSASVLTLETTRQQHFCIVGRIERNEDNAGQPASARAPQVNDGSTHSHTHSRGSAGCITIEHMLERHFNQYSNFKLIIMKYDCFCVT